MVTMSFSEPISVLDQQQIVTGVITWHVINIDGRIDNMLLHLFLEACLLVL